MSGFSVAGRRNGVGQFNSSKSCWSAIAVMAMVLLFGGCQTAELSQRRSTVSADVASRFGSGLSDETEAGTVQLPSGVATDDGITEDEAVAIALWNNAAYQALLADLGVSSAQLLDAGLISDPQFSIFFPLGPKQLEFTTFQAVDALWLQPIRVKAAELDLDRVSQTMVQNGLDVIRDVRVAHANLLLAQQQAVVSREAESLRTQIADLAQKRLDAGDISELEATTSRIDALQAQATASRAGQDVELARQQLRTLIGLAMHGDNVDAIDVGHQQTLPQDAESLVSTALAMRPDLRAAELAIEAACERAGLARNQFMNLDAIYDANGSGSQGFESGLGLRFTIPIFNGNQGGIAIAEAQLEGMARRYVAVRDQVTLEVRTAHTQLEQAQQNLSLVRDKILPALQQAQELARRNYENGGAPYFLVLQTTSQYLDTRMRELQLEADTRRAIAELERGVGMKLASHAPGNLEESLNLLPVPAPATSESGSDVSRADATIRPAGWRRTSTQSPPLSVRQVTAQSADDAIRVPLEFSVAPGGRIDAQVPSQNAFSRTDAVSGGDQKKRKQKRAGRSRSKKPKQDTEHVQVTIDIRLDPSLVSPGVRTAKSGAGSEDGSSED
ncbi:MAG: cobalt-zinc-cadmium efflux system outer membrane protein [Planctomycetaceae bacterium]|jgi:cobalt-zinc-cadmium efflux system outer membrane protein